MHCYYAGSLLVGLAIRCGVGEYSNHHMKSLLFHEPVAH